MKRLIPVAMLAVISLVIPQQAQGAAKAKAGAKCTKVNSTQTVGAKKFTCVKQGKKLIWDKGRINLFTPILTVKAESNNYEWNVLVTNYPVEISKGLEFTYFYSLDHYPLLQMYVIQKNKDASSPQYIQPPMLDYQVMCL